MLKTTGSARPRAWLLFIALFAATSFVLRAQWARSIGGPGADVASFARPTSDGGIVAAGYTSSFGSGGEDVWIVRLDSAGTVLWQRAYGGPADDRAYVVQEVSSGGFVVLGWTESFGAGDRDAWVLRLDASGGVLWQSAYGGAGFDQGDDIRPTPDGGFIAACFTTSAGAGQEDFWLLKLDSAGNIQWQRTMGGAGSDLIEHVETTTDGGYLVAGFTRSFGFGRNDVWIAKLSAAGDSLWQRVIGGPGDDYPEYLEKTSDGGFAIAGATDSGGAGGLDGFVLKLDSLGAIQWQRTYGGAGTDYLEAVRQTADGGFLAGGHTDSPGAQGEDAWALRLDASGWIIWQRAVGGQNADAAFSIQPMSAGKGSLLAGSTRSAGAAAEDLFLFRMTADGRISDPCSLIRESAALTSSPGFANAAAAIPSVFPSLAGLTTGASPFATAASVQILCQAPRFSLKISAGSGGTTDPAPGTSQRDFQDDVQVLAVPSTGSLFDRWSGDAPDASRLSNPVTITMDGDRTIRANFRSRAVPPVNLEGKRYRTGAPPRIAFTDLLTWEPNRANPVVVRYRIYEIIGGARKKLADLPPQVLTFVRRALPDNAGRTYAVATVDEGGFESDAAIVAVSGVSRR